MANLDGRPAGAHLRLRRPHMQNAQGSIAKDTLAVCAATLLLVALLLSAAALWPSEPPPARDATRRFQVQMADTTPREPIPPYLF